MIEYKTFHETKEYEYDQLRLTIHEVNRVALVKTHFQQKPLDALMLHLGTIGTYSLPCSKRLLNNPGQLDRRILNRLKRMLASDIVITLCDIGNCYWSIGSVEKSKKVYLSAISIYQLMNLELPVIAISIDHRLKILKEKQYLISSIVVSNKKNENSNVKIGDTVDHLNESDYDSSFTKVIEITKTTLPHVTFDMDLDETAKTILGEKIYREGC